MISKLRLFIFSLMFLIAIAPASAQSGRQIPIPEASPQSTDETETEIENPICKSFENELEFIYLTERDKFIERINLFGSCGYRLENIARAAMYGDVTIEQIRFTGLVRKDKTGGKYEYSWFITQSPGHAQTLANNLAEHGFYLKKAMTFIAEACGERAYKIGKENSDDSVLSRLTKLMVGDQGIFFLFERKVGFPAKNEYRIVDAEMPNTKFRENQKKMQELATKGFRPVELWYVGFLQYHFLIMEKDENIKPSGEYIFDKELYSVGKDLTNYAKKGFKPLIIGTGLSVLNRTGQTPQNVRYYAFHKFKDVQKNLSAKLKNATLVETANDFYPIICDAFETKWFFEVPLKTENDFNKNDFVFLNISNLESELRLKKGITIETDLTKEQVNEFEKQVTEQIKEFVEKDYEIINFNYLDGFTVMFDRPKKF